MMRTRLVQPTDPEILEAGELIRAGELVAFPTETVYGLGADAFNPEAVEKIFAAKGRPGDNPLIVHIASLEQIDGLISGALPDRAMRLAEVCWPGPLTMILRKSDALPDAVTAGLDTVGIRYPANPVARALIEAARRPIAAPSANRSGRPSPTTARHVLEDLQGRIPLILDGGPCKVGVESTVLEVMADPPRILRPGGVTRERIAQILGDCQVDEAVLRPMRPGEVARSPGMKYRHYAPKGHLTIVSGSHAPARICALYDDASKSRCILCMEDHLSWYGDRRVYSLGRDAGEAAERLFAALRQMDDEGIEQIWAESVGTAGLGLAVMNRMGRAAAFDAIDTDVDMHSNTGRE